jgi:hypothetical protein
MFEWTREQRARIAARWPTAATFYAERDDRTVRVVSDLGAYVNRPVEIHVDPDMAHDATVQRIAVVAANLTARWARRIRIVVAEAELVPELRRDGATRLSERIAREMAMANPFGFFEVGSAAGPAHARREAGALRLFVGPWGSRRGAEGDDYQVHAANWTTLGRRGDAAVGVEDPLSQWATMAAAGLAGSLGAADLFKRAIGHARSEWLPTFSWDTWSSLLMLGSDGWRRVSDRAVPERLDLGRTLLGGMGAIGSAFVYLADMIPMRGHMTLLDRDAVDTTNLNRSPMFTVLCALDEVLKTTAAKEYLGGRWCHGVDMDIRNGVWSEHAAALSGEAFDVWISLTNEHGAWAEVPFQLPPVVLHATTTSGWGFGSGRHIPRREDCTLCRMPSPAAEFRGPCAEGAVAVSEAGAEVRASLPFLSTAAASLLLASYLQLDAGASAVELANDISVDVGAGLRALIALSRGPMDGCRGCRAMQSKAWIERGGRGRFASYSG